MLVHRHEAAQAGLQADSLPVPPALQLPHLILLHCLPVRVDLETELLRGEVVAAGGGKVASLFDAPGVDEAEGPGGILRQRSSLHLGHPGQESGRSNTQTTQ